MRSTPPARANRAGEASTCLRSTPKGRNKEALKTRAILCAWRVRIAGMFFLGALQVDYSGDNYSHGASYKYPGPPSSPCAENPKENPKERLLPVKGGRVDHFGGKPPKVVHS